MMPTFTPFRLVPALCGGILALGLAACGSDRPFEKPAELQPLVANKVETSILWKTEIGTPMKKYSTSQLQLALEENLLFAASEDGVVTALSTRDGRPVWQVRTEKRIASGPRLAGSLLLLGTYDGQVLALDKETGKQVWLERVGSEVLASPVGNATLVVARSHDGKLHAIKPKDGSRLWSFDRSLPLLTVRGMGAPVMTPNLVVMGLDVGKVIAVSNLDGIPVWEQTLSNAEGKSEIERLSDVDAEPLVVGDDVYVGSFSGAFAAISLPSGRVLWKRDLVSVKQAAVDAEHVFVTTRDSAVVCLDRIGGISLWKQDAFKLRGLTSPLVMQGHVVLGDYEGYVHFLNPDSGDVVGRVSAAGDAIVAPLVANGGTIFALTADADVVAISVQ